MEWAELVGPLLEMAVRVVKYAGSVQRYGKKSKLLQGRVQLIEQHLSVLKKSEWVPDPAATQNTLESLCQILGRAEDLVLSCQRQRQVFDFLTSFQNKGEFEFVNQRISLAMESFHLANRTLMLIVLYSDRIFMDVLDTLVEDGACSRLPQAKKEALEKSTREWPYSYNMPPEKKRMLELIRRDLLRQGRSGRDEEAGASSTSASSCDQTQNDHGLMMQGRDEEEAGPSLSADDHNNQNGHGHMHELMQEVDDIVKEIIALEARMSSHNKEEIQRVAQLGQHVVGLLPHLQSHPQLTRLRRTWDLVADLRGDLDGALQAITQPRRCAAPGMKHTSHSTTQLANRIEQRYQSLIFMVLSQSTDKPLLISTSGIQTASNSLTVVLVKRTVDLP